MHARYLSGVVAAVLVALCFPSPSAAQRSASRDNVRLSQQNACASLDVEGLGTGTVELLGTWSGTVTIYKTGRGGTRVEVDTASSNEIIEAAVAGYKTLEACFTTASSGTVAVNLLAAGTGGGSSGGSLGEVMVEIEGFATEDKQDDTIDELEKLTAGLVDLDTGGGEELRAGFALLLPGEGGSVIGGIEANPVHVNAIISGTALTSLQSIAGAAGVAGTPDAQVYSVQGVADMTPVQVQSDGENLFTQTTGASMLSALEAARNYLDALNDKAIPDPVFDDVAKVYGPQMMCLGSAATPSAASDDGDAVRLWCDLNGRLRLVSDSSIALLATYLQPGSSTLIRSDNSDNDDETQIKATAGVLLSVSGRNSHASADAYLRCTNATAASTTPGSTAIWYEMVLPFGGGFVQSTFGPGGRAFDTALTCYLATGEAATDATDPAQDDVVVNVDFR